MQKKLHLKLIPVLTIIVALALVAFTSYTMLSQKGSLWLRIIIAVALLGALYFLMFLPTRNMKLQEDLYNYHIQEEVSRIDKLVAEFQNEKKAKKAKA